MKNVLLWDLRFPRLQPLRVALPDELASAAVRSGAAAAANPAEAGLLSAGGSLSPADLTEVVIPNGNSGDMVRAYLPLSAVMIGAGLGLLASVGRPFAGGGTPTPTPTPTVMANVAIGATGGGAGAYNPGATTTAELTSTTWANVYISGQDDMPANSLSVVFAGFGAGQTEASNPNDWTVQGVAQIAGSPYEFAAAASPVTVTAGTLVTLAIPNPPIAKSTTTAASAQIRSYHTAPGGGTIMTARTVRSATRGEGTNRSTAAGALNPGTDQSRATTAVTVAVAQSGQNTAAPSYTMILGPVPATRRVWAAECDSIGAGQGDSTADARGAGGYVNRAFSANNVPLINMGVSSKTLTSWIINYPAGAAKRTLLLQTANVTDILCETGETEIAQGATTLAVLQGYYITAWTRLRAATRGGVGRVYQTTPLPHTNASNVPTATGSNPNTVIRPQILAWLRDGAPINSGDKSPAAVGASGAGILRNGVAGHPLESVFDAALLVEDPANANMWLPDYVGTDGIHSNTAGHTRIADGDGTNTGLTAWVAARQGLAA